MKAMLLAAGLGVRMRPLTLLRAKPVLPVLNRPLAYWTLRRFAGAGVREAIVNIHHLPQTVVSALGDGRGLGLRLRYSEEAEILGTGGGPKAVRAFFGDDPFLLSNGDVFFDVEMSDLVRRHRESGARATLALRRNPDPRVYAPVVSARLGRIASISGRPARAPGMVSMFAGVHVMDPGLLDRLPAGPSDSVRDLYLPLLAEGAFLLGVRAGGAWYDLGRPSLYRDAQLRLLPGGRPLIDRRARVSASAGVRRSVIGAQARIGAGADVARSVLWEGAVVEKAGRAEAAIVTSGGVVRRGEKAERVIVLPAAVLEGVEDAGGRVERRGDMAWVEIL